MGNCGVMSNQESVVYLLQKNENSKVKKIFIDFQDTFKSGYPLNSFGDTALHYSSALGNLEMVQWLVENGAEVNHLNSHKWTATDSAHFAKHSKVLTFLQSKGGKLEYFRNSS
jgi:hypothetical protein